jgi:carbon storage regulator
MLILSRRIGESIMIGDEIIVTVMQVDRGGQVRIGVHAPAKTVVDREEIHERKKREAAAKQVSGFKFGETAVLR